MVIVKAQVKNLGDNYEPIIPTSIPDLNQVREFPAKLHTVGKTWKGETFGWQAEYNPGKPDAPLNSKMAFTPADFCIGESSIWFFSLMWEYGKDKNPVEFLDNKSIS